MCYIRKQFSKPIFSVKIFRFLYKSFVSIITLSENIKQKSTQQLIQTNYNCKELLCKQETKPQENNNAEARSQQSLFVTLLKSHPRTDTSPKILSKPAEHPPSGEHCWGTASVFQNNFKTLRL